MEKYKQLCELVDSIQLDADKFWNKKNNAAGTRVRKGMQDIKSLAQEIRSEVQQLKNSD